MWLYYYETDVSPTEAKASIDLTGTGSSPSNAEGMLAKYPEAFEVAHPRRRTYYLRPVLQQEGVSSVGEAIHWIETLNAAVDSIGKLFTHKFRRSFM